MTKPKRQAAPVVDADAYQRQARMLDIQARRIQRLERETARQGKVIETGSARLAQCTKDLSEAQKRGDHLSHDLVEVRGEIIGLELEVGTLREERDFLSRQFDALLQRYVGVKLDTQQFTFAQARGHLDAEWAARDAALKTIRMRPRNLEFVATAEPGREAA